MWTMRVRVDDVSLWYDVLSPALVPAGDRMQERPVLVGVHGGPGGDSASLATTLAPLTDVAQVIRYDQRGHGRSERSHPERWTEDTWADDLRGLCEAIGIERPIVFGGSFGGRVALAYAARHPDHPTALIVGYCGARIDKAATIEAFRRLGGEEAAAVAQADFDEPGKHHERWLEVCWPLYSRRVGAGEHYRQLRARSIHTPEVTAHYNQHGAAEHTLQHLDRIRCPVLLLVGEDDPGVPVSTVHELTASLVNAQVELVVLPDCGHAVFRDQPERAYQAIRGFIARVRPAETA
jgi:pimeloyl-ACP methyl ester carboxylesterase